jgi:hypothetical protein
MDQEPRQTFKVERIIALKRFEQPPPGYFHLLPDRIISRIEKGEGRAGFWETWLAAFGFRPALVYAFGLTVCGAVTVGMFFSPKSEATATVSATGQISDSLWTTAPARMAMATESELPRGLHTANWLGSTSPVLASETATLFDTANDRAVPVSFLQEK